MSSLFVVGNSLTARLCVWALHEAGLTPQWLQPAGETAATPTELAVLPGPTLSLAHQGQKLWQDLHQYLSLPEQLVRTLPFYDLATSPLQAEKLTTEALLDALVGEPTSFEPKAPLGLHPRMVVGARSNPSGLMVVPDVLAKLDEALADHELVPRITEVVGLDLQSMQLVLEGNEVLEPARLVIADDALAARLLPTMGLKPRRRHTLTFQLSEPLELPQTPCLVLHRMPKGHLWLELNSQSVQVVYDGVADARQHTAALTPDEATVAALATHVLQLLPFLRKQAPAAPMVTMATDFYLPDFLPALGAWGGQPRLLVVGATGAREGAYAPALAQKLTELVASEEFIQSLLIPSRFMAGQGVSAIAPESLVFEPPATPAAPSPFPEASKALQGAPHMKDQAEAKRMDNIQMTEKKAEMPTGTTFRERSSKPKVQRAALKT